jgi:hypothetical protein
MAPERLDEGITEFGGHSSRYGSWFFPFGRLGKFFSKFFATKAQDAVAAEFDERPKDDPHPLAGDTVVSPDVIKVDRPGLGYARGTYPIFPEQEIDRKRRYKTYENMDDYPEIGAAFDIYADDSTQKTLTGERWDIISDNEVVIEEVKNLFKTIKLDRYYWDIVRNTVKYGDCFIELVVDLNAPKAGIQRIKILNPNYIFRVENEYGYLTDFLQEIPLKSEWDSFGSAALHMKDKKFIELDKNQIVHFRLRTADPRFYPYGKSIAALARHIYRSLKMMEDAMLIYRLTRAPERRIFYLDVGGMPANKAEQYVERQKAKFKKEKYYNSTTGNVDARYNPLSQDEDFWVPIQGNSQSKIDTLPGAQNLGDVDDVKYFRDKLLACLKIPKDFIVEKDQSPERKANLSQLDVKFARTIGRVQLEVEIGLDTIVRRHLALKQFPKSMIDSVRTKLPDSSDMHTKRQLDVDEQKARVIQAVMGLGIFPVDKIYKDYYDLSDHEIEVIKEELKKDQKEQMQMQAQQGMMPGAPGMAPPGGMPGAPMPGPEEAGGQESDENTPPTEEPQNQQLAASTQLTRLANLKERLRERGSIKGVIALTKLIKLQESKLSKKG